MAEVHVTTIQEFRSAVAVSGNTVIVDNDIDAQSINWSPVYIRASLIDGKGHTIYNIQATSDVFYQPNATYTIKDLSFKNILMLGNGGFFTFTDSGYNDFKVENCQFQGKIYKLAGDSILFTKCFFDITVTAPWVTNRNRSSSNAVRLEQCYFIINSITLNDSFNIMFGNGQCTDCYFKGNINITRAYGFSNGTKRSVLNFDSTGSGSLNVNQYTGFAEKCVYNSDKMSNVTNAIACTDAEMKNAQTLKNKGFDIIV